MGLATLPSCRRFLEATAQLEEGEGAMQEAGSEGDNQRAAGGAALGVEVLANHVRVAPQYSLAALRPGVCLLGRTLNPNPNPDLDPDPNPNPNPDPDPSRALLSHPCSYPVPSPSPHLALALPLALPLPLPLPLP